MLLSEIYCIWERDMKLWLRQKWMLLILTFTPGLYIIIFANILDFLFKHGGITIGGISSYVSFYALGAIGMATLQGAMVGSLSVFLDRQTGAFEEILVLPLSRVSLYIGRLLAVTTKSLCIPLILFPLSIIVGATYQLTAFTVLSASFILIISALAFAGFSITTTSFIRDQATYNTVINLFIVPILLLSNIYYPLDMMPPWARAIATMNPLTYAVKAMRDALLQGVFPAIGDMLVLLSFMALSILIGALRYRRMYC